MEANDALLDEAGLRKAAVLVAGLTPAAADSLLSCLDPRQAEQIRRAAAALPSVEADERRRVIEEFRRRGRLVPDRCPAGIELSSLPVEQSMLAPSDAGGPAFLDEIAPPRLAELLSGERPATVALLLAHMPPARAGEILAALVPETQVDVLRRMLDLEAADPETLREVQTALAARLSRSADAEDQRRSGPQAAAKILECCDEALRDDILENLAARDRELAEQFGHRPPRFEELLDYDDTTLAEILRAAPAEVVQAALFGAAPEMFERLLGCLTPEESRRLRRWLGGAGPIRLSDIEAARKQLAVLARRRARTSRAA
jgi:flagellar motor switch protein FliG